MIAGYQWRNIIPGGGGDQTNNTHNRAVFPGNRGVSLKQHAKEKLLEGNGAGGDGHAMEKKTLAKLERDGTPPIEFINQKLPKEMILRVFSFLDVQSKCRSAQVCRFWSFLARDGSIWQDVDLFDFQKDMQGYVVENLSKRCGGFLKRMLLRGCRNVTDEALVLFAQLCINIEDLNIEECVKLSDETCKALGTYCKRLRRLRMASCSGITNVSLRSLGVGCHNLQVLEISWNGDLITKDGLAALARSATQLRVLIAKGLRGMTDLQNKFENESKSCLFVFRRILYTKRRTTKHYRLTAVHHMVTFRHFDRKVQVACANCRAVCRFARPNARI